MVFFFASIELDRRGRGRRSPSLPSKYTVFISLESRLAVLKRRAKKSIRIRVYSSVKITALCLRFEVYISESVEVYKDERESITLGLPWLRQGQKVFTSRGWSSIYVRKGL